MSKVKFTQEEVNYWTELRNQIGNEIKADLPSETLEDSDAFQNEIDVEFLYKYGFDYADVLEN